MSTDKIKELRTYLNDDWEAALVCSRWGITKYSPDEELKDFIPKLVKIASLEFDYIDWSAPDVLYPEGWFKGGQEKFFSEYTEEICDFIEDYWKEHTVEKWCEETDVSLREVITADSCLWAYAQFYVVNIIKRVVARLCLDE